LSDKELEEIREIINSMQTRLIQLFDELRELRQRLSIISNEAPIESHGTIVPLFSEVKDEATIVEKQSQQVDVIEPTIIDAVPKHTPETTPVAATESSSGDVPTARMATTGTATVARMLDPIAHELRTGEAPAEVIAEYLQAAKDYLIGPDNPNERVASDMDVVLKFLRARGKKAIRPEERENILKRISRWKAKL
jgi:hypothetical protein